MKIKLLLITGTIFLVNRMYGQTFQGKVVYDNRFTSKVSNVTDEQMRTIIGARLEYFIREGCYKSLLNGRSLVMQLYNYKDNRLYNQKYGSDTLYWFDASKDTDELQRIETRQNAAVILGKKCDAIIFYTKAGVITTYYSSDYKLDVKAYSNHQFNNWNVYAEKTGALPLKTVIENNQFKMESTAVEITPLELDPGFFSIGQDIPVRQSAN